MHSDVSALSKASIWREASRIVCEEGVRAFWRGNLVTIAHRLPYSSISFYAYERYKLVRGDSFDDHFLTPESCFILLKNSNGPIFWCKFSSDVAVTSWTGQT